MAGPNDGDIRRDEAAPRGPAPLPGVPQAPTVASTVRLSANAVDGRSQFDVECEVKFVSCGDVLKTGGSNAQAYLRGAPDVVRGQLEAALRHLAAGVDSIRMPAESRRAS